MPTITVLPDSPGTPRSGFRAVSGQEQSVGPTVGQALDALESQIGQPQETTLVIVQPLQADDLFPEGSRRRLTELMDRWRGVRDSGRQLSPTEHSELENLTEAEIRAAGQRAAALLHQIAP